MLHGQLVGMIASPITGLVRGLNALIAGLAIQLQQIAEQGLVGGGAEEAAPAEEPAPPRKRRPRRGGRGRRRKPRSPSRAEEAEADEAATN